MMYYRSPLVAASNFSSSLSQGWYNKYVPIAAAASSHMLSSSDALEMIGKLVSRSAVVIFSSSSCCMCHAVKRLLCGMGVNPTVYELDQHPFLGKEIGRALLSSLGNYTQTSFPIVFIGGKLVGGMERVMASHINATLVPLLKEAGALWL